MSGLNYLRIAQILGGTVHEIQQPTFGVMGAAQASAERFRLLRPGNDDSAELNATDNELIRKAFEATRDHYEVDRVLIDPVLSKRFIQACRQLGVKAPVPVINRRLQAFRKSTRYKIKLEKTKREAGIDPEPYFYAAELGYVQLSYRRDASVDDIVTDPEIGKEFADLCRAIRPDGSSMVFKYAALRLRKMRSFSTKKIPKLLSIDVGEIEEEMQVVGTLDRISAADLPKSSGIFSFAEDGRKNRYLYVGSGDSIRDAVEPFSEAKPFYALAGRFWSPSASEIKLSVGAMPKRWHGASLRDVGFRLIHERHPLFNMPVEIGEEREAA